MRSLQADKARLSLLGLMAAGVLLIAWMAWFFLARMTVYETGQLIRQTAPPAWHFVDPGKVYLL